MMEAYLWVWKLELDPKAHYERLLLLALAHHADRRGRCWPSHNRLAQMTGMSRRSVLRYLAELETLGLIRSEQRTRADGGKSSKMYVLLLQGILDLKPPPLEDDEPTDAEVADAVAAEPTPHVTEGHIPHVTDPHVTAGHMGFCHIPSDHQSHAPVTDSHNKNSTILNSRNEPFGAGARATPSPTVFVREDDRALFKHLEALHCKRHGRHSAPRKTENGYSGWFFPKADIDNFRDRGGKVLG